MSSSTIGLSNELRKYMLDVSFRDDEILKKLRNETLKLKEAQMQISSEQGAFLSILIKILNAKKTLDIGVFTGYSSLVVARELPDDGLLIACDTSIEWTNIAKKYWRLAKVDKKIDLHISPAKKTLEKLIKDGQESTYDFSFIDADKINYINYFEIIIKKMKKGGLIVSDNVLWSGKVLEKNSQDEETEMLKKFNSMLKKDKRITNLIVPLRDGLSISQVN